MKACVVRRQFYSSELNTTVMIHAEPGFGTPKAAICYFVTTNTNFTKGFFFLQHLSK